MLGPGDLLAADLRLTESWALRVNEAALTGESRPVPKQIEPLPEIVDSLLAERRNMAFRGTAVTGGRGAGVVVATGMATELGRLAELLQRHPAEPTPLQRRPSSLWSSRTEHPSAVLKVPPSTGRMALVYRPRSGEAAARGG